MNKPDLYRQAKKSSMIDAQQALEDFENVFKWRTDSGDSVLDAGCGPGDITRNTLLPFLPENFKRLVGVDISDKMINFARTTHIHPKLSFEQFNLEQVLEKQSLHKMEPFNHIFSFYVLMYIHKQKTCIENFYKLLKNEGDMLLSFLAQHPHYDVYKEQSQDPKWAPYMKDVDLHLSPYHFSKNPGEEFRNLLIECGFTVCDVKVHDKKIVHTLDTMQSKRTIEKKRDLFVEIRKLIL